MTVETRKPSRIQDAMRAAYFGAQNKNFSPTYFRSSPHGAECKIIPFSAMRKPRGVNETRRQLKLPIPSKVIMPWDKQPVDAIESPVQLQESLERIISRHSAFMMRVIDWSKAGEGVKLPSGI
jgi:hypothetical protein